MSSAGDQSPLVIDFEEDEVRKNAPEESNQEAAITVPEDGDDHGEGEVAEEGDAKEPTIPETVESEEVQDTVEAASEETPVVETVEAEEVQDTKEAVPKEPPITETVEVEKVHDPGEAASNDTNPEVEPGGPVRNPVANEPTEVTANTVPSDASEKVESPATTTMVDATAIAEVTTTQSTIMEETGSPENLDIVDAEFARMKQSRKMKLTKDPSAYPAGLTEEQFEAEFNRRYESTFIVKAVDVPLAIFQSMAQVDGDKVRLNLSHIRSVIDDVLWDNSSVVHYSLWRTEESVKLHNFELPKDLDRVPFTLLSFSEPEEANQRRVEEHNEKRKMSMLRAYSLYRMLHDPSYVPPVGNFGKLSGKADAKQQPAPLGKDIKVSRKKERTEVYRRHKACVAIGVPVSDPRTTQELETLAAAARRRVTEKNSKPNEVKAVVHADARILPAPKEPAHLLKRTHQDTVGVESAGIIPATKRAKTMEDEVPLSEISRRSSYGTVGEDEHGTAEFDRGGNVHGGSPQKTPSARIQCYICSAIGHGVRECPQTVEKGIQCFRCKGFGHVAYHCTADATQTSVQPAVQEVACYLCQQYGHKAYQCPLRQSDVEGVDLVGDDEGSDQDEFGEYAATTQYEAMELADETADQGFPMKQVKCFSCGEFDHTRKDCPKPKPKVPRCIICKIKGHLAADCPQMKEPEPTTKERECFRCKTPGHEKANCPFPKNQLLCYKCKKLGHRSTECPLNVGSSSTIGKVPGPFVPSKSGAPGVVVLSSTQLKMPNTPFGKPKCNKCGSMEHQRRDCPTTRQQQQQRLCFNCGDGGHNASQCPRKADFAAQCYICKGYGHMAAQCHIQRDPVKRAMNAMARGAKKPMPQPSMAPSAPASGIDISTVVNEVLNRLGASAAGGSGRGGGVAGAVASALGSSGTYGGGGRSGMNSSSTGGSGGVIGGMDGSYVSGVARGSYWSQTAKDIPPAPSLYPKQRGAGGSEGASTSRREFDINRYVEPLDDPIDAPSRYASSSYGNSSHAGSATAYQPSSSGSYQQSDRGGVGGTSSRYDADRYSSREPEPEILAVPAPMAPAAYGTITSPYENQRRDYHRDDYYRGGR